MATKVSLGFAKLPDTELDNFAQGVIDAMTGNGHFPSPPLAMPVVQAAKDGFTQAMARAQTGGPAETAAKNNARQLLVGQLRVLASYVQMHTDNDMSVLLSSGFQAQSAASASVPLDKPEALNLKNGGSGELIAAVDPVKNCRMYEGRIRLSESETWLPSVFTGDSRHIIFNGLTAGKNYTAQVRALGGSTGQSDWSDPSSHMAM